MGIRVFKDEGSNALFVDKYTATDSIILAAGTPKSYTFPEGYVRFLFSSNAPYYRRLNAAATIPAGDVTNGTASLLRKDGEFIGISADQTGPSYPTYISLISDVPCTVTIQKIPK